MSDSFFDDTDTGTNKTTTKRSRPSKMEEQDTVNANSITSSTSSVAKKTRKDDGTDNAKVAPAVSRVSDSDLLDFRIECTQSSALKDEMEIITNVLQKCRFQVCNNDKFKGIKVECMDDMKLCLVLAKLSCTMTHFHAEPGEDTHMFWFKMAVLNNCIKSISNRCSVEIYREKGSSDIHIAAYEPYATQSTQHFTLPTLECEDEVPSLGDILFSYSVEFDLGSLRSIVNTAKALHATDLYFKVYEPKSQGGADTKLRSTYFVTGGKGDAEFRNCFCSTMERSENRVEDSGGALTKVIIKTASSGPEFKGTPDAVLGGATTLPRDFSKMNLEYEGFFSVDYLSNFIKSMTKHSLMVRLAADNPLVLHYAVGSSNYISFVLAPKLQEETQS